MRRLTVRLSPHRRQQTLLAIYPFSSLAEACDAAPLALEPSSIGGRADPGCVDPAGALGAGRMRRS